MPTSVFTVGAPLSALVLVLGPHGDAPATLAAATSWWELALGVVAGVFYVSIVSAWWMPRVAGGSLAIAALPAVDPLPGAWADPVAWVWAAILLADLVLGLRQRELAASTRDDPEDGATLHVPRRAHRTRWALVALLVGLAAWSVAAFARWRDDLTTTPTSPNRWPDVFGVALALLAVLVLSWLRKRRVDRLSARASWVSARARAVPGGLAVHPVDDVDWRRPAALLPVVEPMSADTAAAPDPDDWWHTGGPVEVAGLAVDGSVCVVRRRTDHGHELLGATRPARDPWTLRWLLSRPRR